MLFSIYLVILVTLLFIYLWKRKQCKHNYAPGPPSWPIIGSLPYVKQRHLHFVIDEWAKQYGDIINGKFGSTSVLFIRGVDNVLAGLRKEEFQARPDSPAIRDRSFNQKSLGVFFSNDDHWTMARKFTVKQLRAFSSSQTEQFMRKEIDSIIESLQDESVMEINGIFAFASVSVIWLIIANKTFQPEDEWIRLFLSSNKTFFRGGDVTGGISGIFPILRYMDKSHQRRMSHIHETQRLIKVLVDEHRQILDPNHPFDLIDYYLVEMDKNKENSKTSVEDLMMICFDLFSAGAEPLSAAMDFILLYMVLYPEVQKKLQEEIDTVLGKSRKPLLEDKNRLHYTMAVLSEVERINPTAPVTVPHRCTKDTYFQDYFVEKDTTIFMSLWSLGKDIKYWDNPEEFRPERFLDSEGKFKKSSILHPFGLGARVCAGESLTRNITFLFITTFLEKFSVSLPEGAPLPSTTSEPGFTVGPKEFRAKIKARY